MHIKNFQPVMKKMKNLKENKMTNKQIFDELKQKYKNFQTKKKMVKLLRSNINAKLSFEKNTEDVRLGLLQQLRAIEINDTKLRRNKFDSKFYEFTPVDKKNFGFKQFNVLEELSNG